MKEAHLCAGLFFMSESVPITPETTPAIELFRAVFPSFKETATASIAIYLKMAEERISCACFGKDTQYARQLWAAHMMTINGAAGSSESSAAGGFSGAVASKSVGSMSISYDTGGTAETDAGFYNLTPYGKQLFHLMRQHRRMPFVAYGRALEP